MGETNRAVAQRIKLLRRVLGMNQSQFATFLGVQQQRLSNVENGINPLSRDLAFRIRERTGVTTDWLWFGDARGMPYQLARDLEEAGRG
jgi:transcriptional regulator with XRE-family HTH domain